MADRAGNPASCNVAALNRRVRRWRRTSAAGVQRRHQGTGRRRRRRVPGADLGGDGASGDLRLMFVLDTNVGSELRKTLRGKTNPRVADWATGVQVGVVLAGSTTGLDEPREVGRRRAV